MSRTGILLINLGTPKSFKPRDVFHYLNEFLTDSRVLDLSWLRRQLLARGLIVPFRYKQSAALYKQIWTKEGSPLLIHSVDVQKKLQVALGEDYIVELAMRYQFPSIPEALSRLEKKQLEEIIILPLFPQYASATTGSVQQHVMKHIQKWSVIPKLTFINHFYNHAGFIKAICERGNQYPLIEFDHILFSFHGLPERQILKSNPNGNCLSKQCCLSVCRQNHSCYKAQCYATASAIADTLNLGKERYTICFQSRLGKEPWIQPYATDILHECAKKGYKKLLVFSPSFVCDCLETISEIGGEYLDEFRKLGGEHLQLVEGLNSHPSWIEALCSIVKK